MSRRDLLQFAAPSPHHHRLPRAGLPSGGPRACSLVSLSRFAGAPPLSRAGLAAALAVAGLIEPLPPASEPPPSQANTDSPSPSHHRDPPGRGPPQQLPSHRRDVDSTAAAEFPYPLPLACRLGLLRCTPATIAPPRRAPPLQPTFVAVASALNYCLQIAASLSHLHLLPQVTTPLTPLTQLRQTASGRSSSPLLWSNRAAQAQTAGRFVERRPPG